MSIDICLFSMFKRCFCIFVVQWSVFQTGKLIGFVDKMRFSLHSSTHFTQKKRKMEHKTIQTYDITYSRLFFILKERWTQEKANFRHSCCPMQWDFIDFRCFRNKGNSLLSLLSISTNGLPGQPNFHNKSTY